MKKRKTNIKQHFIPQFYLKNFVDNSGKFIVYDIKRNIKYTTSPSKESYEKYFYDINLPILKLFSTTTSHYEEIIDEKIRILNEEVSAISLNLLKNNLSNEENIIFEKNEKEKLYDFIILQMIRTPFYRNRLEHLGIAFMSKSGITNLDDEEYLTAIHNLLIYGVIEKLYSLNFNLNKKYYIIFEHLIDEIFNIKKQLRNAEKLFLINKSKDSFICSNSQVNVLWKPDIQAHVKGLVTYMKDDKKCFDIGNYIEFYAIHFPISSDFSIFIFDKSYNRSLANMNQKIGIIREWNSDLIMNLNYSTFLKSSDKIYRKDGHFDDYIEMKNQKIDPIFIFEFDI